MKSRWVEAVRRGVSSHPSPRASHPSQSTATLSEASSAAEAENPAFLHWSDRCESVGDCSVARVLENCVLQGGMHHTHMNMLTYLGRPLRSDYCCYPVSVQWFRAFDEHDDFQVIPGACDEFFTPSADDIGARILAKVMIEDEDVVKTKMLEYGPIKEDPEVRSKVEMYLERKSVLFMGLQSVAVRNNSEYPESEELRESWTLLIDDRRVRLTCESSLLPPFESLYTPEIKLEVTPNSPNEFCLYFNEESFVRLRAESNLVRDIIVLTLRAFCKVAVENDATHEVVARGLSPMLTLRTLAEREASQKHQQQPLEQPAQEVVAPVPSYDLPWNRGGAFGLNASSPDAPFTEELQEVDDDENEDFMDDERPRRKLSITSSLSGAKSFFGDEWDESLLLDAEALIGNGMKMGLQYQIMPREPKRISIMDIPDLQIVEMIEDSRSAQQKSGKGEMKEGRRRRRLSAIGSDGSTPRGSFDGSNSGDEDSDFDAKPEKDASVPLEIDPSCIDDAIKDFMESDDASDEVKKGMDVEALRSQYVAIFVALQRELHQYKQRVTRLTQQLDEKRDENAGYRNDIDTLQDALRSLQVSNKMFEMVRDDLRHEAAKEKRAAVSAALEPSVDADSATLAAASKFFIGLSAVESTP